MLIFKAGNRIYSQVKQLHRRTLESIKSFLFGGYQRLPKASAFLTTCREPKVHESFRLEEYKNQEDIHYVTMEEEEAKEVGANGEEQAVMGSFLNFGNIRNGRLVNAEEKKKTKKKKSVAFVVPERERSIEEEFKFSKRAEALEKKLKEMVMEECEEEDLMDIHEFMHYYKRLTCPFYIEMVNSFFSDMFG